MMATVFFMWVMFLTAFSCEAQTQNARIRITPNSNDITLFQEAEFRRVCEVEGVSAEFTVRFVWERDGNVIDILEDTNLLQLSISEVQQVHAGHYTCRVELTPVSSGAVVIIGPTSAGTLTVLAQGLVNAPRTQVLVEGISGALSCSYPGGLISWQRGTQEATGVFPTVSFTDEGSYTCDIYIPASGASTQVTVMLLVVVPVEILETSRPVHQNLTSNREVLFTVDFRGRVTDAQTIEWFHNDLPLSAPDRIHSTFDDTLATGRTELRLPRAMRVDAGLYRVVISNRVEGAVPVFASQEEVTFQIDVTVRPVVPVDLRVDQMSSSTSRVSWTLANRTSDEGADHLILRVTFANHSLVDQHRIAGHLTSFTLENLIPAHDYVAVLTAVNGDGEGTTNPVSFSTSEGAPLISNLTVERVNMTFFVAVVHLAYTGGGPITMAEVSYRPRGEAGSGVATVLMVDSIETVSPLMVRVAVLFGEQLVQHEAAMELTLSVLVQNSFGFPSLEKSANVSAYSPPTTATPVMIFSTTSTPERETELLPLWLIAVIASVVTILIMLVLVACTVAICIRCRTHKSDKFKVDVSSPAILGAAENGVLPAKPQESLQVEHFRARSQSSSVPSETYTPSSLDEHFMGKKHKRELSECSSIGVSKVTITPSTTASNSPSNFSKAHFINNSEEKGLDRIIELELVSRGSDDSGTESERDRLRHQEQRAQHKLMSASRNNVMNYQYVRGHADGSVCGSSHHSLVSNGHPSMVAYPPMTCSDPKLQQAHSRGRAAEYMYSDCESVASTDVSCSQRSLPSFYNNTKHLRPVQHRSPTPYNHEYPPPLVEGSVV